MEKEEIPADQGEESKAVAIRPEENNKAGGDEGKGEDGEGQDGGEVVITKTTTMTIEQKKVGDSVGTLIRRVDSVTDGTRSPKSTGPKPLGTFQAHERDIWSLCMMPNPSFDESKSWEPKDLQILSAGQDGTVVCKTIHSGDGECLALLPDQEGPVFCASVSPDGKIIASAGYDSTIRLWPLEELTKDERYRRTMLEGQGQWDLVREIKGHTNIINCVCWNSQSNIIASCSNDNTVRTWRLDGTCTAVLKGHKDDVRSCMFTPDDKYLISGSWDRHVRIWRLIDGKCVQTLLGHKNYVWCIDVSQDGDYIATCSWDETCRIWARSGKLLAAIGGHDDRVTHCRFVPDGDLLATASMDCTAKLWTLTGKCIKTYRKNDFGLQSLCWSLTGYELILGSVDGGVKVWEVPLGGKPEAKKQDSYDVTAMPEICKDQQTKKKPNLTVDVNL